jgi:hypothetical protein
MLLPHIISLENRESFPEAFLLIRFSFLSSEYRTSQCADYWGKVNLFRGEMDAWWEVIDGCQVRTFIGARRKELEIDKDAPTRIGSKIAFASSRFARQQIVAVVGVGDGPAFKAVPAHGRPTTAKGPLISSRAN